MIYAREDIEEGLHAVMFPVRKVDLYAETETGRRDRIPGKKAVINTDSRKVLSVVSDRYRVLPNREALKLAYRCCVTAFPNTAHADWRVFSIEAPQTGGHCRIDLEHSGRILTYDWAFSDKVQDRWKPFVRMTNSYNRTHVFSLVFGFVRSACENGMIDWRSSIRIRITHSTKDIEKAIERDINEAKFSEVKSELRALLSPLVEIPIDHDRFWPVIQSALEIRMPKGMPQDRRLAWGALALQIHRTTQKYIDEFGNTAYALMNAITDVATRPPDKVCGHCLDGSELHTREHEELLPDDPRGRPYRFIHRERHTLQRLAAMWVAEFSRSLRQKDFDLHAYLKKPSRSVLRKASNHTGMTAGR